MFYLRIFTVICIINKTATKIIVQIKSVIKVFCMTADPLAWFANFILSLLLSLLPSLSSVIFFLFKSSTNWILLLRTSADHFSFPSMVCNRQFLLSNPVTSPTANSRDQSFLIRSSLTHLHLTSCLFTLFFLSTCNTTFQNSLVSS